MSKRVILAIFSLLVFSSLLSACSLWQKEEPDNWQDDILMAGECGEEGLQCCIDQDPACDYGSCCVDPNNPSQNYCSESCDFGKEGTFCRAGNECDEGLTCSEGRCELCGGADQPCCANKACAGDELACFRGTCVACGVTGNPCCQSAPYCKDGGVDNLLRAECKDEICALCGANGNEPCQEEPVCNENHLLNIGHCYRCGGFNQPCCHRITPEKTEKYCVEEGLSCTLDFCSQ